MQNGKCSKTKNAHEARESAFAAIFISQIICWMFHLKESKKQQHFASSYGVWLQKREQEPLVYHGKVLEYDNWAVFPRECLQIPVSCWQMSKFTINQTELITFRSPGFSNAGIQRSVAYTDGQGIDTHCCSISTALALSAVVIRRRMMETLFVFLFSEAFSK